MSSHSNPSLSGRPDTATPRDDDNIHINGDNNDNNDDDNNNNNNNNNNSGDSNNIGIIINEDQINTGGYSRRDYNRPQTGRPPAGRGHNRQRSIFNLLPSLINPFGGRGSSSSTPMISGSSINSNNVTSISSSSISSSSGRGSRSRTYGRDYTYLSTGIALWLEPPPNSPLHNALQSIISGLKPLFDDGHDFAPHITITTGIILNHNHNTPNRTAAAKHEIDLILDQAVSAARSVNDFTIRLDSVKMGAFFFKKVYFEISPSNAALTSLAQLSREVFVLLPQAVANQPHYSALSEGDRARIGAEVAKRAQQWAQTEFDPHLSLVYSEVYPVNEALQRTIHQRLEDALGADFETRGIGWSGGRLSLMRCEGPIHQWNSLGHRDI